MNQRARPGLRVLLAGPPGNPDAIGAQLRVRYAAGREGPCRSVQAGSGYWSQDSATQVLGCAEVPVALWIRWPGGAEQTVQLKAQESEIQVEYQKTTGAK